MKRIIFCVTNDLSYDQRMQRICRSLIEAKYEVLLVGRVKPDSKGLTDLGFPVKRLNCFFTKGKLFYLEYNLRLLIYLFTINYDIGGAIDLDTIIPVYIASKLKGKKTSFDAHEYFEEVPEVTNRPLTKWIWKTIGRLLIPKMNTCYTVGNCLAELFKQKYNVDFGVIRNMPLEKNFENINKPLMATAYILYQGALNEGRGLEQMILAMKSLPQYKFLLAGEGDHSIKLRALTKDENVEDRVIFLGYQNPIDLDNYTAGAYVGLNLLENNGLSYYYSLANKCFDYIQFGVPVINMDFPEYRKLNEEFEVALLLKTLNIEKIVSSLEQLFEDINLHHKLRSNCLKARVIWNWDMESKNLIDIYSQI
jgi:glycosyltransferase involved in cell wall biosynthesis